MKSEAGIPDYYSKCKLDLSSGGIYSTVRPIMAFLSDENRQCHQFVTCKDFMLDIAIGRINNEDMDTRPGRTVYYSVENSPKVCLHKTKLICGFPDARSNFPEILQDFLRTIEDALEIEEKTNISSVEQKIDIKHLNPDINSLYVIEASGDWMSNPTMLSLYLEAFRDKDHKIGNTMNYRNHSDIIRRGCETIKKDWKEKKLPPYPKLTPWKRSHGSCGIRVYLSSIGRSAIIS